MESQPIKQENGGVVTPVGGIQAYIHNFYFNLNSTVAKAKANIFQKNN